jgi:hypothetical protein
LAAETQLTIKKNSINLLPSRLGVSPHNPARRGRGLTAQRLEIKKYFFEFYFSADELL